MTFAITTPQLARIMEQAEPKVTVWQPPLNKAMDMFDIDTPLRSAAFLAQVGHESGRLQYVREIWNPKQVPAQATYEGRADLGNTEPGDGFVFRGRGLIQITGRKNYRVCGEALNLPLELHPELLEQPMNAAMSAAWYWSTHGCNKFADAGDFDGVSDIINRGHKTVKIGDTNGYGDRLSIYTRAKFVLMEEK